MKKKYWLIQKGLITLNIRERILLTPNKKEASEATQIKINDKVSLEKAIKITQN